MLKTLLRISLASIAIAGVATAGTVTSVNFAGTFDQVQAFNTGTGAIEPVAGGFIAVGTSSMTDAQISAINSFSGRDALAASFTQFGDASTFGTAAVNSFAGYFSFAPNGDGGSAAFSGNQIYLIGGNGDSFANSTSLFVARSDTVFGADAPLFSAAINLDDTILLGASGGTNTINAGFGAFQMKNLPIPEPGVSILALFSAGLLVLRRRRR